MILDENGNQLVPNEASTADAVILDTAEAPANEAAPETSTLDRLDPILKPMGKLSELMDRPHTDDTPKAARALLAEALDAFAKEYQHTKVRRGIDYDITTRGGKNGQPVIIGLQDNSSRGRDFVAAWSRFMESMDSQAREAQQQAITGILIQKIQALESIVNQLLVDVATIKTKVR